MLAFFQFALRLVILERKALPLIKWLARINNFLWAMPDNA